MATYKRPGTYVSEVALPNTTGVGTADAAGAFIGTATMGKTTPVLIGSWNDYVTLYGGWSTVSGAIPEMAYGVYNFFANGGKNAWVLRVVGSASASATCQLTDGAATPQNTVALTAISPGTWGNALYAAAVDRDAPNGRFDLSIYRGGTAATAVVETFYDVSVNPADSRYLVSLINAPVGGSRYVTAVDNHSATASPANRIVQVSPRAFASGLDGAVPGTTEYQASFAAYDIVDAPLILAVPGVTTTAVVTSAITYCEARGDVFFIIDPPIGLDAPGAVSFGATFASSSFAAVYWPNINLIDPNGASANQLRLSPPSGAMMGIYSSTDALRGVWKAPAGLGARVAGAVSLERKLTNTDYDTLNVGNINAIKPVNNAGIVVYGARTLKKTAADKYINVRRTLIYLERALQDASAFAVFENNDADLWAEIHSRFSSILGGVWKSGGLRGATSDDAFYVTCDGSNNTRQTIDAGQVNIDVGVALQQPAEFIVIRIGQWTGGGSNNQTFA